MGQTTRVGGECQVNADVPPHGPGGGFLRISRLERWQLVCVPHLCTHRPMPGMRAAHHLCTLSCWATILWMDCPPCVPPVCLSLCFRCQGQRTQRLRIVFAIRIRIFGCCLCSHRIRVHCVCVSVVCLCLGHLPRLPWQLDPPRGCHFSKPKNGTKGQKSSIFFK